MDSFLLEAMTVTDASAGAVFDRVAGTEFQVRSLAQDGSLIAHAGTGPLAAFCEKYLRVTQLGSSERLSKRRSIVMMWTDYYAMWFPEAAAFHRQQGNKVIWDFPFRVGGKVIGFLGLAFRKHHCPVKL
jgi:hypothetical protein